MRIHIREMSQRNAFDLRLRIKGSAARLDVTNGVLGIRADSGDRRREVAKQRTQMLTWSRRTACHGFIAAAEVSPTDILCFAVSNVRSPSLEVSVSAPSSLNEPTPDSERYCACIHSPPHNAINASARRTKQKSEQSRKLANMKKLLLLRSGRQQYV
jgi:hypothetical protein